MKIKFLVAALLLGTSISGFAQGYKDGIEYYKIEQYDNAKELLERNLNDASTNKAEAYYYLGKIAMHKGDVATAKSFFDKGLQADANNPYNIVGQGAVALKNGDLKGAENSFNEARKLTKKDSKLEIAIARAYYDINPTTYDKQIKKSIADARKWNPKDPDSYIFEGDEYSDQKDWGNAAGQYELAMNYDNNLIEPYVKYANTYYNVNPKMAIQKLQELLQKNPNSALAQRQLAEKYYLDNQGAKAAEQYGEYIKNPNHFAQDEVRYVQLLFFGEKYEDSYALASKLVASLPAGDPNIFYMERMQLYNLVALKKYTEAAAAGKSFFALSLPQGSTYEVRDYTDYAEALQNAGQADEAVKAYEKAIELNPKNVDLMRNLSDSYTDSKDYVKAAKYYQMVIDSGDYKANDLYELSVRYFNLAATSSDATIKADAVAKARKYADDVNKLVPNNVRIVNQIAKIEKLAEGENHGKAAAAYKNLIALLDSKEDKASYADYYIYAYNYLATYAFNSGDKEGAKVYYRKWLENDPNNADLRKFVEQMK